MDATQEKSLNIGYINLRAQTGFGLPKQLQVEQFLKSHKIDILHLQEAQILENTFEIILTQSLYASTWRKVADQALPKQL